MNYKITRVTNYQADEKSKETNDVIHKKHGYVRKEMKNGKWRYYYDYNNGDGWSDKVGVSVSKNKNGNASIELFNTKNDKYYRTYNTTSKKKYGALTVEKAEDGISYKIDIPTKKISQISKQTISKGKNALHKLFGKR